ncbi:DUF6342 family protein [Streptomyces sp. NPDC049944]|uniref:DUF6342 family protein n=1 Tax=Streptomyces sp. NPDC049944 TaxID=3155657 RepID=UPI0034204516
MPELDLGIATDWMQAETHGRVRLVQNRKYPTSPKKDVQIVSPNSIEIQVNSDESTSTEADKVFFTTSYGTFKKVIAVLDSEGNLRIAGRVIENQGNLDFS